MNILANDGLAQSGIDSLQKAGFNVLTTTVAQEQLVNFIIENNIEVLLVRSATKVRKDIIDNCPGIKIIGRGGVGMDNIDVDYAVEKGIRVINTPASSSISVAELVFAHLFGMVRFLYDANRNMPLDGDTRFKEMKKKYAQGSELRGKTLGIIGIGRIGQEVARIALGIGMKVIVSDIYVDKTSFALELGNGQKVHIDMETEPLETLLAQSDFITVHIPASKNAVIGEEELKKVKKGVGIVNTARGGAVDEVALITAIENGKVAYAGLDVFENEPTPAIKVLMHPEISLSPHIGAATIEAQERIGTELAEQIIGLLKESNV